MTALFKLPHPRRSIVVLALLCLAALAPSGATAAQTGFPPTIALPSGFQPEGIASGRGAELFVGSIPTGAIWAGSARTGEGEIRVPGRDGRSAIGIKVDARKRIFVAGGATGEAFVYDARSGADRARYRLAPEGSETFVNDLVLTRAGAYFTDSLQQQLYLVPSGRKGALAPQSAVRTIPLTGDISYTEGNNANGIAAAKGGKALIVVQGNVGKLFRVNARTGRTREIDLGDADVLNGDGLLRRGRTLFVVQNRLNRIAVIRLNRRLTSGRVTRLITNPAFDVPTTLASAAGRLFTVNARFGTPPQPDTAYDIVRVR